MKSDKLEDTYLWEYYRAIKSGEIIAGHELILELEQLIDDYNTPDYYIDRSKGLFKISFMENCVRLTKSPFYGKPMKLMLWQKAFIETVYSWKMTEDGTDRFRRILLEIARKNGKALDLDTRIPTPSGDRTIRDIEPGDYVFDENGYPVMVKAVSEVFHDRECYEITFEDGEKIVADANHKWTVQTKEARSIARYQPTSNRKRTAFESIDSKCQVVKTTKEMSKNFVRVRNDGKGKEYRYRVPMAKAIQLPERDLPLDPYILGVWLGDGDHRDNRIAVGKDDLSTLLEEFNKRGMEIRSVKMFSGKYEVRFGHSPCFRKNEARDALRELNVWGNKHIPEIYLQASERQRIELLKGLMDTDGTVSKAGQCDFVQKKKVIIDGMSRLLSSLGIKHHIYYDDNIKCGDKICSAYGIRFYVDKTYPCFSYERKNARLKEKLAPRMGYKSIVDIKKIENRDTKCICVDSDTGLFLCGERNTVTHNSEMCSGIVLTELITGPDGSDIVCSSNDDNQANILYEATNAMRLMIDPQQKDTWKTQQYLRCNINGSKVFKLSDRTKNKEGRNIDEAVVDEVHEMKDNVIVKSIEQSQSLKPNPKLFLITTEGFVNDGFLDEELKRARAILNGEDDSISSRRYLPWLYTQDSEQEVWKDETSWFKSNPSLGVVKRWDYLREQVDLARKSKADRMFTLSKDFNIKVSNSEAWLTSDQLSYSKEYDIEDFRGAVCLGGVDLAETTDLCSAKILLMKLDDKTKYIKSMYWIPEAKLERSPDTEAGAKYSEWAKDGLIRIVEGNEIDVTTIADWFYELYKDFGIKTYKVGYDQRFANEFIKRMDEYSFETEMVYQNRYVLSSPMRLVEADIQDELINFNNNEIDRWCLENTAVQVWDTGHIMPIKIKGQSSKRIDGTLSLVMSYEMLRRHRTEFNNTLL